MTESPPPPTRATVFIVDDDEAVRDSLELLVRSVGLPAQTFASALEFLDAYDSDRAGCLVLDMRMPEMSGLDLQDRLRQLDSSLPVIFITGHGDVPMAVKAMRLGAVDFLQKPFSDQQLLDRVHEALSLNARALRASADRRSVDQRLHTLTPRESEVLEHVVAGEANKVIASHLGLSQRTVEIHRANIMRKMEAGSLAELVRMVIRGAETPDPPR